MTLSLVLALVLGPAATLPLGTAQSGEEVTFTRFDTSPQVLSREGGVVSVDVTARTNATQLVVTLQLVSPDGALVDRSGEHTLVSRASGTVGGRIEVPVRAERQPGEWRIRVDDVLAGSEGERRSVESGGDAEAAFEIYPLLPVAGTPSGPWPQPGGDPGHTGRTVAQGPGPREKIVNRWTFQPGDGRPVHSPVIGPEGLVYAVTWAGTVYALNHSGELVWDNPRRVRGEVPYPPAVGPHGNVLVPGGDGILKAITPEGDVAWSRQVEGEDPAFRSGPTVGPEGRILYLRTPWTLVGLDPGGGELFQTRLPAPQGDFDGEHRVPEPVPGPRVAVEPEGPVLATAGAGLAVVAPNGSIASEIPCSCPPRAVGLAPDADIVFVVGDREIVAASTRTHEEVWSTDDRPVTRLEGQVWHPPTVGWNDHVYVASEDGRVHNLTVDGDHVRTLDFHSPVRGQPAVDANGNLYFADACRTLRSVTESLGPRWTREIDATGCGGLAQGVALTPGGGVVWPTPDGRLSSLGSNRPPTPAFDVRWDGRAFVFDASASSDPDDADLTFAWTFGSETEDRGRVVRPDLPPLGDVNVTLTVSDGLASASQTRQVEINYPPRPAIANETRNGTIALDASGTEDPEGDRVAYRWTVDGQRAGSNATIQLPAETPRVYNVTLTAGDGNLASHITRTVLAPDPGQWTHRRLALIQGDCPAGVCTVPAQLAFVEGDLAKVAFANGAGRTVRVDTGLSTVAGGPEQITLGPREQQSLYVRADGTPDVGFRLDAVGADAVTSVPVTVDPAPAEVTWRVRETADLVAGQPASLGLLLSGGAPPGPASVRLVLTAGDDVLGTQQVDLPGGEPVDRVVEIPFTPRASGTLDVQVLGETETPGHARLAPADASEATRSLSVAEPGIVTLASRALVERPYLSAASLLVALAGVAGAGLALLRRRREPAPPTTRSTGGAGAPAEGGATVAEGFMPRKVDRFRVERVLGEGGFGTTYLAEDGVLGRDVVLKDLENVGGEARELLLHEARTAANLQHSNVVVVHDVIEEEGRLLLVMEYVEGGTLDDRADGGLGLKEALPIARDVLDGLAALHEAGIVHRDLKPSNILIAPDGTAKITDFGVAGRPDEPPGEGEVFVGTPRYMAPEQLAGGSPGPEADVYAAGALVYRALTGDHHLGLGSETPPPEELLERDVRLPVPGVPGALNRVLARALARDPDERFPDALAFREALARLDPSPRPGPEGG